MRCVMMQVPAVELGDGQREESAQCALTAMIIIRRIRAAAGEWQRYGTWQVERCLVATVPTVQKAHSAECWNVWFVGETQTVEGSEYVLRRVSWPSLSCVTASQLLSSELPRDRITSGFSSDKQRNTFRFLTGAHQTTFQKSEQSAGTVDPSPMHRTAVVLDYLRHPPTL